MALNPCTQLDSAPTDSALGSGTICFNDNYPGESKTNTDLVHVNVSYDEVNIHLSCSERIKRCEWNLSSYSLFGLGMCLAHVSFSMFRQLVHFTQCLVMSSASCVSVLPW